MGLGNLCNKIIKTHRKLSEKFDHLYYASLVFLTVDVLDAVSTSINVTEYTTFQEQSTSARYLMDQFGVNKGLIIHSTIAAAAVLGTGYALNKVGEALNRPLSNRIRAYDEHMERFVRNSGSVFVYGCTLVCLYAAIHNFR